LQFFGVEKPDVGPEFDEAVDDQVIDRCECELHVEFILLAHDHETNAGDLREPGMLLKEGVGLLRITRRAGEDPGEGQESDKCRGEGESSLAAVKRHLKPEV